MIAEMAEVAVEKAMVRLREEATEKRAENDEENTLVSINRACELLGRNRTSLWRWEKECVLLPVNVGGRKKYRLSDINVILKAGTNRTAKN